MTKSVKRLSAVFLAVIMMFGVFGMTASASEPSLDIRPESLESINIPYTFNAVVNDYYFKYGFNIVATDNYKVTFSGAKGSGAIVDFIKIAPGNLAVVVHSLAIPVYISGMPATLSTSFEFDPGMYTIKIRSASSTASSGSFTIYDVAGKFELADP